jgi:hypothetical protein
MLVDWTDEYQQWRDRLDIASEKGNADSQKQIDIADAQMEFLTELELEPEEESPTMMKIRQSGKYQLWRVSHRFISGIAVRTVAWFPDDKTMVLVAIGAEKSSIGDLFYDSIAKRADAAIDRYLYNRRQGK